MFAHAYESDEPDDEDDVGRHVIHYVPWWGYGDDEAHYPHHEVDIEQYVPPPLFVFEEEVCGGVVAEAQSARWREGEVELSLAYGYDASEPDAHLVVGRREVEADLIGGHDADSDTVDGYLVG